MTALEFIKTIKWLPMSAERPCSKVSNSEIRRWLDRKSVIIDGIVCSKDTIINWPVDTVIFFPKGKRKTTYPIINNLGELK